MDSANCLMNEVFDGPFYRIFLPKDNQVLTLVLGGKFIDRVLFLVMSRD